MHLTLYITAFLTFLILRYSDDDYEYRHVQLPKDMIKKIPKDYFDPSKGTLKLLWEEEWRGLGITQACAYEGRSMAIACADRACRV